MAQRQIDEKERWWRDRVGRQGVSGLSVRQFCAQERIAPASFYAWRRRLKSGADVAERRPVAGRGRSKPGKTREFIPLSVVDVATTWEVVHPHGYRVRVNGEIDAAALGCILKVLDERLDG
jgi:transposase